ncbi:MAG: hypothetical protein AAF607_13255 [Pseudomonadota bacterium]
MAQPKQTPLSYSLPAFSPTDYDNIDAQLQTLASYGFKWVTFTPTYRVKENVTTKNVLIPGPAIRPQPAWLVRLKAFFGVINKTKPKVLEVRDIRYALDLTTMPMIKLEAAVNAAVKAGFHVKIEPHLDYAVTLGTGFEQLWRMLMRFHPDDGTSMNPHYYAAILQQIFQIIQRASTLPRPANAGPACFALTLGSEIDVSVYEFPAAWEQVLRNLKALRAAAKLDNPFRLSFGHKLNYDTLTNAREHLSRVSRATKYASLGARSIDDYNKAQISVKGYLSQLDYVSFSFYQPITPKLATGTFDWESPPTPADEAAIAAEFGKVLDGLRSAVGPNVPLDIGEFGLGSVFDGPFRDEPGDFVKKNAQGNLVKDDGAHNARRKYIRALSAFLKAKKSDLTASPPRCSDYLPLTFWTVKHYDFLGLWDYPILVGEGDPYDHKLAVDDALKEWVTAYHNEIYGGP